MESNFGKDIGGRPLSSRSSTLVCYAPRRNDYFKGELMATLKIVQDGDINPANLRGSWAGAFGHTQFMPSTFQRLAVDGDGDGRRDIMTSVPDAVHSTANFLKKAGWVNGLPWGYEVRLPAKLQCGPRRTQEQEAARILGRHGRDAASTGVRSRAITPPASSSRPA